MSLRPTGNFSLEGRHVHFVGIGGIGMSGLAKILIEDGYEVSGSDLSFNRNTDELQALGATVRRGHAAENAAGADLIVMTSAAAESNPEILWGQAHNVPVIKRAVLLGKLMGQRQGIAISGTHGKTTTTGMVAVLLMRAGLDPTIACGGDLLELDSNAKLGYGSHFVAEADEFDRSFLQLPASIKVITNLEADHLDLYGTMDSLRAAFRTFAETGTVVANADDPETAAIASALGNRAVLFSRKDADGVPGLKLRVPGAHNLANALAALKVADVLGVEREIAVSALNQFRGTKRRLELITEINGVRILDDYAHHPTEIKASLAAARELAPTRLVVVFQPHLYARTKDLFDDFVHAFEQADETIIVDTYSPAGREEQRDVTSEDLARAAGVRYLPTMEEAVASLNPPPGSMVIAMGAGTITRLPHLLISKLNG